MSDERPPAKRVRLSRDDLEGMTREEMMEKWAEREAFIDVLMSKYGNHTDTNEELTGLRESEEKLKQQQIEATRRENVLVMRLTTKEQDMQEYVNQIQELKQGQNPSTSQLRAMLLDPAINLMFQRMKKEMDACKEKLEQAQNDLAAWKFTPDSQTGKRLMAKCRMLLQENEELGKTISSGRTAKLEGEIALEKTLVQEMKKSQAEMDEFLVELDEDVEGMQSTIYILQQQLKEYKDTIAQLTAENQQLRSQRVPSPSNPTPNTIDTHVYNTPHSQEKVQTTSTTTGGEGSPCSATSTPTDTSFEQRTNPQEYGGVSNYNSHDQSPPHVTHSHPQTTNGDHHGAMETDTSDGQPESCDEDQGNSQYIVHQTNSSKGLNSHASSRNHSTSDGAYGTENTDATSSEGWSPQPSSKDVTGMAVDDDQSSEVSEPEQTDSKPHRGEDGDSVLQNGLIASPQSDSPGEDDET